MLSSIVDKVNDRYLRGRDPRCLLRGGSSLRLVLRTLTMIGVLVLENILRWYSLITNKRILLSDLKIDQMSEILISI